MLKIAKRHVYKWFTGTKHVVACFFVGFKDDRGSLMVLDLLATFLYDKFSLNLFTCRVFPIFFLQNSNL